MRIKPIIGIFAVASGTIFLTACDDAEKVGGAQILANFGISDPVTVATLAEVPREPAAKPPCVDPGWRLGYCDENGDLFLYP